MAPITRVNAIAGPSNHSDALHLSGAVGLADNPSTSQPDPSQDADDPDSVRIPAENSQFTQDLRGPASRGGDREEAEAFQALERDFFSQPELHSESIAMTWKVLSSS
jgi:hypothetical protein